MPRLPLPRRCRAAAPLLAAAQRHVIYADITPLPPLLLAAMPITMPTLLPPMPHAAGDTPVTPPPLLMMPPQRLLLLPLRHALMMYGTLFD